MVTRRRIFVIFLLTLIILVSIVSAASDYCTPPENLTTVIDNNGGWWNITITSDYCYTCIDNGFGNISCTACDNDPPASIANLAHTHPSCTEINWTWDNPSDADFNHTVIYWNDVNFFHNLSNTTTYDLWYGLWGDTTYNFSAMTCDLSGNCNTTHWVNTTETTTTCTVAPVADFTVDDQTICEGDTATFTDLSTNTPTVWNWAFGDGNTSYLQDPTHQYDYIGLFDVSLKAGNDAGDDTEVKNDYINVTDCTPPDHIEKLAETDDCYNVYWTWIDPTDPDFDHVEIYQNGVYLHDVAAGVELDNWSTLENATWYNISTRTVDTSGNIDTDWVNASAITDICVSPPAANFTANVTDVCVGDPIQFTDLSSPVPIYWYYAFGDGGHSYDQNPVYSYSGAGLFDVALKVGMAGGSHNETIKYDYINVSYCEAEATASFTSNVTCGIVPFVVAFNDTSTGENITDWYWMFGDGNTSVEQHPVFGYNFTGMFTINFSVTNSIGTSWSNITDYMTARPPGDTCAPTIGAGESYDTDKFQPNWFTSWFI